MLLRALCYAATRRQRWLFHAPLRHTLLSPLFMRSPRLHSSPDSPISLQIFMYAMPPVFMLHALAALL